MAILWSGPALDPSGYGEACRGYVAALKSMNVDVRLQVIKYTSGYKSDSFIDTETKNMLANIQVLVGEDWQDVKTAINHATPDILRPIKPHEIKEQIAYSVWETDKISKLAKQACNRFDLILTASEYSKAAFINGGVTKPVQIIPHVIKDRERVEFDDMKQTFGDKFVFFSNFEWHIGKGYDLLFKAYIDAFAGNKDVLLVVKTNSLVERLGLKESVVDYIKSIKKDKYPAILPITDIVSFARLYGMYSMANCYVLPTRREAWCLTASEAAMFELPIIIPEIGGQRQFLEDGDALFIKSKMLPIEEVELERSNYMDQQWVEPDLDSLKDQMLSAYNEYEKHKENAVRVKQRLLEDFSETKIARLIMSTLEMHRELT